MFFKRKKTKIKEDSYNCVEIMKKFAEGKISVYDFWDEYNNNNNLFSVINNDCKFRILFLTIF